MNQNTQKVTVIGTKNAGFGLEGREFKKTFESVEAMEEWASSEEAINHYHIEGYCSSKGGR